MSFRFPSGIAVAPLRAALLLLALGTALPTPAYAQAEAVPPAPEENDPSADSAALGAAPDPLLAELEARRTAVESDASLTDEVRAQALELLARAVEARRAAASSAAAAAAAAELVASAPQRIAQLKALAEARSEDRAPEPDDTVPVAELSARAQTGQQELIAARQSLAAREKALADLNALGPTLSEEIARAKTALRELRRGTKEPALRERPETSDARAAFVAAEQSRLAASISLAEFKLANYDALVQLATLERDAAALLVPRLDAEREALSTALEARRADQARTARAQAQLAAVATASLPGVVNEIAADTAKLGEELETVTLATAEVADRLRAAERQASEIDADLASIRERVQRVGATETVGRLLRRRLQSLDGFDASNVRADARASRILDASERRFDLGETRRALADTKARIDAVLAAIPEDERAVVDEATLGAEVTRIVTANRAAIDALHGAYGRYLTRLTGHDAAERHLAATAAEMLAFIRNELLWIRSMAAVSPSDLAALAATASALVSPVNWRQAFADARRALPKMPWRSLMALGVVVALFGLRPWARRKLAAVGELTARIRTDAFGHTVVALLVTVMLASAWPVLFTCLGWLFDGVADAAPFSRQISHVLTAIGPLLIVFSGARWVLHPGGLAMRHFGWTESIRTKLVRELGWLMPVMVVCTICVAFATRGDSEEFELGRYALMVFSAALAVFSWRVFRRDAALMTVARARYQGMLGTRTWALWFPLTLAVPGATFIAAAAGYGYTANVVARLLVETGYLVLGVWVLRDVLLRWFTVAERRLRFERALALREELRAEREKAHHEGAEQAGSEQIEVDEPQVDFRELGDQGRAVVQGAVVLGVALSLWTMWAELLPALNVLDNIHLPFTRVTFVGGLEQQVAVTAADALIALLALMATLFAARNLSGLLGFTLLRRFAVDAGAQYAIVTLCQYALVAAGALYAFSAIGMQWSKLQWLVAALSVGLGFGLQEIVANFVSGIILLLERPVRVGDFVTVGDATGTVARIQIRATTILDLDRKELVLPNKEFITGRVLNWTLSSGVLRVVVPVGIAYGSDARRARELMLEAAAEDENVVDEPPPNVLFRGFDDNALGLELRAYVPSIDRYMPTITSLHDAVYQSFIEAGISISFPQRDVHLDTRGTIDIRLVDGEGAENARRGWWRGRGGPGGRERR